MASVLRYAACRSSARLRQYSFGDNLRSPIFLHPFVLTRSYAKAGKGSKSKQVATDPVVNEEPVKSGKGPKSTANLVPGSKQPITDPAAQEEYAKAEQKMTAAIDWFRKDCASAETRASGRVTPALLSPVRVKLPKTEQSFRLEELSTVGVRNGSELVVTVFEEESLKHVERALYDAKLPNITPQKLDNRTLKIPIPKPTVEARNALFTAAERQAEDTRVQIRKHHQASLKKGKYKKHSIELEEFQKLTDRFVGEVDKILTEMKKVSK